VTTSRFQQLRFTRLQTRVLLAMVLLLLGLLLGFFGFSYWSLQRGLGGYVAQIELGRLEYLESQLRREYAKDPHWASLTPERWNALTRFGSQAAVPVSPPAETVAPRRATLGPALTQQLRPIERHPLSQRLGLLDNQGKLIAGVPPTPGSAKNPLFDGQHMLIGTLTLNQPEDLKNQIDNAFLKEHLVFLAITGLLGLLLAGALSWWLSRRWIRPIEALSEGAKAFASGQLDYRIAVAGHDELVQLADRYNHMAEQLSQAQAQQHEWLTQVAHELRTPLAAVRAEIEAVQDGIRSFDAQTAARLHRQILRLTQLVSDMRATIPTALVVHAPEAAPALQLTAHLPAAARPLDMRALTMEAVEAVQIRFSQAGISLPTAQELLAALPPAWVQGNAQQLHQVLSNILENSLRYTDAPGRVSISASLHGPAPDSGQRWLELHLDDSSPSVPPAELPRIFERFYRVETSRSRASGGSGLGLAICKSIVQAHGGQLQASISSLGGLRLTLILPLIDPVA
jgi:two-component system, OmpR family, sensor histidine kinase BaeS